jgi:large subunit ribosomal protein L24
MRKVRKGDEVQVIAGRDKGRRGTVKRVISGADGKAEYVVVENVNERFRHRRPNPVAQDPGGRIRFEAKIHVSNVGLHNPETQRAGRVRIAVGEDGRKMRVFASSGKEVVA